MSTGASGSILAKCGFGGISGEALGLGPAETESMSSWRVGRLLDGNEVVCVVSVKPAGHEGNMFETDLGSCVVAMARVT